MCVHDGCEIDLAALDGLLQNGCDPIFQRSDGYATVYPRIMSLNLLLGICGIDDNGILGLIVNEEVGIVIVAPGPYIVSV